MISWRSAVATSRQQYHLLLPFAASILLLVSCSQADSTPTPKATVASGASIAFPEGSPTPTDTASPTKTAVLTTTPPLTPLPTLTPTPIATPTPVPTPIPTVTRTAGLTTTPPAPETSRPLGTIHPVADEECAGPFGDRCIRTIVTCPGIADATVRLRVTGTGAKGTVLLTVGGPGTGWYRVEEERREGRDNINGMMDTLLVDGYNLVEVRWVEPGIWEGPGGSISLACRSATVFDWVHENIHQGGVFAAQGNSGGSAQIAFSLAYYGLDEVLDLANLSGGPPPCPISTNGEFSREEQLH